MAKTKSSKTTKTTEPKLRFTVTHAITDIYVMLMFTFFPIFLSNAYFAARRDKFWLLIILTAVAGVTVGILTLVYQFTKNNAYNKKLNTYHDPWKLSVTDIAVFSFVGLAIVSTIGSEHFQHCLTGLSQSVKTVNGQEVVTNYGGRNMGIFTILILLICYLIISRFYFHKSYIFYAMFLGVTIVSVLAILNYYSVDPLGLFSPERNYSNLDSVVQNFTSTIGNKNYLSAFVCVALPFSVGVAMTAKNKIMLIVAHISTAIQFMGLLVATSDGGFLGFFAMLIIVLVIISRNPLLLSKFFFSISVMATGAILLKLFDIIMKGKSKGYTSFSELFMSLPTSLAILGASAVLTAVFAFIYIRRTGEHFPKFVLFIVLGVAVFFVLALVALVIYYSCIDTKTPLTGFKKFLRFDEKWGTHRGYFWIKSVDIWTNDFNLWEKLFGTGPDTYYFAFEPYFSELTQKFNESSTNTAHNVYLNYLITNGLVGLLAYLGFIGSSIVLTVKRSSKNPLAFVCLLVILTYALQDFVNIANPVNTPLFIIFIALSESTLLRANSHSQLRAENY